MQAAVGNAKVMSKRLQSWCTQQTHTALQLKKAKRWPNGAYRNTKPHLGWLLACHYTVVFQLACYKGLGHYRIADGHPHA